MALQGTHKFEWLERCNGPFQTNYNFQRTNGTLSQNVDFERHTKEVEDDTNFETKSLP